MFSTVSIKNEYERHKRRDEILRELRQTWGAEPELSWVELDKYMATDIARAKDLLYSVRKETVSKNVKKVVGEVIDILDNHWESFDEFPMALNVD